MIKDISYTEDCDFYLTKENKIKITNDNINKERMKQGIIKRLQSSSNDYLVTNREYASLNLRVLIGKPLNESLVNLIQNLITQILTFDGLVPIQSLRFRNSIISKTELYIVLEIISDTELPIQVGIMYDTRNTFVIPRVLKAYE